VTLAPDWPSGLDSTCILKPKAISRSSLSSMAFPCFLATCRREARDQTAFSLKPTPVEILDFHIHCKGR
jgi:hypothetical protein